MRPPRANLPNAEPSAMRAVGAVNDAAAVPTATFATTDWSAVVAASEESSDRARGALQTLCQTYWYPLYACLRRQGRTSEDAQDLVQGFLAHLIEQAPWATLSSDRGRFRSFLRTALHHYVADQQDRARAKKRGGGQPSVSLDAAAAAAEVRYRLEAADHLTPDRLFDRRWAYTLLETVLHNLHQEFATKGKGDLFDALRPFLLGDAAGLRYVDVAARLQLSEAAAKMTVTRMRQRYRELLRTEVACTLADPDAIEDELQQLIEALR
jgi:RNA polymerase sigma-70 factor (ECF subfamily)